MENRIQNRVYRLKHDHTFNHRGIDVEFKGGEEFHLVNGVLYMKGFPVSTGLQFPITDWIKKNKQLFVEDTRNF